MSLALLLLYLAVILGFGLTRNWVGAGLGLAALICDLANVGGRIG